MARECEVPKSMIDAIVPNLKLMDISNYSQY